MSSTPPDPAGTGRRVIVTRPADQADTWVQSLEGRGIPAVAVPLIGIAAAADGAAIDEVWSRLAQTQANDLEHDPACHEEHYQADHQTHHQADHQAHHQAPQEPSYQLLVFVSPNAAARFFARRPDGLPWPASVHVASPGPGTTASLLGLGVPREQLSEPAPDAAQFDSESLWLELRRRSWRGARVLIVRGEGGRGWLAEQLASAGADVEFLAAYRRVPAVLTPEQRRALLLALASPLEHLWFFSSSEAVAHLIDHRLLPDGDLRAALAAATALATHPRIAERATHAGFGTVWSCRPSVDAVVACIQSRTLPDDPGAPRPAAP